MLAGQADSQSKEVEVRNPREVEAMEVERTYLLQDVKASQNLLYYMKKIFILPGADGVGCGCAVLCWGGGGGPPM